MILHNVLRDIFTTQPLNNRNSQWVQVWNPVNSQDLLIRLLPKRGTLLCQIVGEQRFLWILILLSCIYLRDSSYRLHMGINIWLSGYFKLEDVEETHKINHTIKQLIIQKERKKDGEHRLFENSTALVLLSQKLISSEI